MQLEQTLNQAKCTFPFTHLGADFQPSNSIFTITTWLPNAEKVNVIDLTSSKPIGTLKKGEQRGPPSNTPPKFTRVITLHITP